MKALQLSQFSLVLHLFCQMNKAMNITDKKFLTIYVYWLILTKCNSVLCANFRNSKSVDSLSLISMQTHCHTVSRNVQMFRLSCSAQNNQSTTEMTKTQSRSRLSSHKWNSRELISIFWVADNSTLFDPEVQHISSLFTTPKHTKHTWCM